jgi:hypothetical protein
MIVNDCICCGPCVANKRDNKNLQLQDTRSEREHHLHRLQGKERLYICDGGKQEGLHCTPFYGIASEHWENG